MALVGEEAALGLIGRFCGFLGNREVVGALFNQRFEMVAGGFKLSLGLLAGGDVDAVANDVAAGCAVFDDQQPATVIELLLDVRAVS